MKNKVLILIGLFVVSFILYNRLFRIRLPKTFLEISNSPYYYIYILIVIGFILLLCLTIIQLYKYLLNIPTRTNSFMKKWKYFIEHSYNPIQIISKSMSSLDAFLKNQLPHYDDHYSYSDLIISKSAHLLFNKKIKIIVILLLLRVLPQLIVCISFVYDILLNDRFYYFYKSLYLLIFPLLIQYIVYSIVTFIETNLDGLNEVLELRILPKNQYSENVPLEQYEIISIYEWRDLLQTAEGSDYICYNNLSQKTLESFDGDLASAKYTLEVTVNFLNEFFRMNNYMKEYSHYKFILETPIKLIKYTIYIIGWSYIVY